MLGHKVKKQQALPSGTGSSPVTAQFGQSLALKFLFLCIWPKLSQNIKQAVPFLEVSYNSKISCMEMRFGLCVQFWFHGGDVLHKGNEKGQGRGLKEMKGIMFMHQVNKINLCINPNCCRRDSFSYVISICLCNLCGYHCVSSANHS